MSTRCEEMGVRLSAYLDGELGDEEAAEVREHIEACPACRSEIETLKAAAGMISRSVPGFDAPGPWREVTGKSAASVAQGRSAAGRTRKRRGAGRFPVWPLAAAAAAAAVIVVANLYVSSSEGPAGTIRWAEAPVLARASADERWEVYERGESLPAGSHVLSREGRAEIILPGGIRVEMDKGAELRLSGPAGALRTRLCKLASGEICCAVPPGYGEFSLKFASGAVDVTGTEFDVAVADGGSAEVTTFTGAVKVSGTGRTVDLRAGMTVATDATSGPGQLRRVSLLDRASWRRSEYREELARALLARPHSVPAMPPGERHVLCDFENDADVELFFDSATPRGNIRRTAEVRVQRKISCQGTGAMLFPADATISSLAYAHIHSMETDWSGWRWHRFEVHNPSLQPLRCQLLIKEAGGQHYGERYNQYLWLDPGWNTVEVNLEELAAGKLARRKGELGATIDPARAVHWVFSPLYEEGEAPPGLENIRLVIDFIRLEGRLKGE